MIFNCGYDPTCAGWVIREGSPQGEHIATCRSEKLANEFVELFRRVLASSDEKDCACPGGQAEHLNSCVYCR